MSDEEEIDDDAVAAEWAAMAEGDEAESDGLIEDGDDDMAAAMGGTDRVLDQTEIDSLLGFDGEEDDVGAKSGIQALISSGLVAYERLPMLIRA